MPKGFCSVVIVSPSDFNNVMFPLYHNVSAEDYERGLVNLPLKLNFFRKKKGNKKEMGISAMLTLKKLIITKKVKLYR